jgi:hypothetical protein
LETGGQPFWEEQVGKKERDIGEGFGSLEIRHGREGNPRGGEEEREDLKFRRRCCDLPGVWGQREARLVCQLGRCGAAAAAGGGTDLGGRRADGLRLPLLSPFSAFEFGRAGGGREREREGRRRMR